jgi:hypothetical protein
MQFNLHQDFFSHHHHHLLSRKGFGKGYRFPLSYLCCTVWSGCRKICDNSQHFEKVPWLIFNSDKFVRIKNIAYLYKGLIGIISINWIK